MAKYLDKNGLIYLWQKIVAQFVSKESGKGLSTNDFTTEEKQKLSGIAAGAQVNVKPDWNAAAGEAAGIMNKPSIPTKTSDLQNDSGFITEKQVPPGAVASNTTPKMDGVASPGSETGFARGDHVHPSDTSKADKATTLAGYGIADAYTKSETYSRSEIDGKISSTYKAAGNILFANLPTPSATNLGFVYNMLDAFTTDERFVASEPTSYPIGTNVVVIEVEDTGSGSQYRFDVLAGFVDLSDYMKTTDMVAITNQEIDEVAV